MTYNTIPITSGAAKFSTLDPDAPLFIQENNITRGADPESPITFYNQQTGELNAVNSIITSEEELNINSSDLIGVKRFICEDYLGAIKTTASDTLQSTFANSRFNNIKNDTAYSSQKIRIPSNIASGSSIRINYTIFTSHLGSCTSGVYLYDPDTETKTILTSETTGSNTTKIVSCDISNINPAEIYGLYITTAVNVNGATYVYASSLKVNYDFTTYSGAVWDLITL